MKKWLGAFAALALSLAIFYYFYSASYGPRISSLESIVPEDAMYYVYSYNLNKKIEDFSSSQFFRRISESSAYKKFIEPEVKKYADKVPFIKEIISRDAALAVFSSSQKRGSRAGEDLGRFLLLARVDTAGRARVKKAIADFYLLLSAKGKSAVKKYQGVQITSYALPSSSLTVHYALISDVIVLANDAGVLQVCIDLAKSKDFRGSLFLDSNFQRIIGKIEKDSLLWGYSNTRRYYQEMLRGHNDDALDSKLGSQKSLAPFANMKTVVDAMNTLVGQSFYLDYDEFKSGFIVRNYIGFNSAGESDALLNLLTYSKPIDESAFKLVPKSAIAYYGISQDFANIWKFLIEFYSSLMEVSKLQAKNDSRYSGHKEMIEGMSINSIILLVESFLGVSIEKDVIPAIGNNMGIALAGFDDVTVKGSSFILPQAYVFCEMADSVKAQNVMKVMTQSLVKNANYFLGQMQNAQKPSGVQGLAQADNTQGEEQKEYARLVTREYGGITINSIDIADFPLQPLGLNYCILGKYLVASLSLPLTKKIIDVHNNKEGSFDSNYYFKTAREYLSRDCFNVAFLDFRKTSDSLKATKSFQDFKEKLPPAFSKEDIDSLVSIGESLKAITSTTRLLDSETIESLSYIEIEGLLE